MSAVNDSLRSRHFFQDLGLLCCQCREEQTTSIKMSVSILFKKSNFPDCFFSLRYSWCKVIFSRKFKVLEYSEHSGNETFVRCISTAA